MKIRKITNLTQAELNQIMCIWLSSNIEAHSFISEKYWQANQAEVRRALPAARLYVMEEKQKIIGFAGLQDSYIAGIFIDSHYRSQGWGQHLLNELKNDFKELTLAVYAKNQKAVSFYLKNNFVKVEQGVDQTTHELEYQMQWKMNE